MLLRRHARRVALSIGVAVALASPAAGDAHGFAASVPRGGVALPAGARDLGAEPAATPLRAIVALKPRDPVGLAAYAAAVSDPSSPLYHHYLSVAQFERRFAPAPAQLRLVRARLRERGLIVGPTSANGLSITVRGGARVTADAFSTAIDRFSLPGGETVQAPATTPRLGGAAGALVQGIVGLDTIAPRGSVLVGHAIRRSRSRAPDVARRTESVGPQPCSAATDAAGASGLTPNEVASRYGLSNFYTAGDEGRGVTIALYELEPFSASDIAAYQACMGTSATVVTEPVDGGAGSGSGSGEAASDIEDLIGLAPEATIRVYEGPQSGEGAYATAEAIVSDDAAKVVSTSWGLCEAEVGSTDAQAEDTLYQEAAAQGQTVIAAAGDSGADDCGNGARGVDDPASQPWVTGVGGTSARGGADTVWNDSLGAGGGGASQFWGRPSWQTAAVAQTEVTCGSAGTSCREVPDVSDDADPATGYPAFYRGGWRIVGGTSLAAPTFAALVALSDASPACGGHPLGFLDPALYAHESDFADVVSGSNSFGGVSGHSAAAGYDMASGLGTSTAALGPALCGDSLSITAPGAQSWTTGGAISLDLHATSARGGAVTWAANGLPAGLTLGAASGRVFGTPTAAGHATVTVIATDGDGATAQTTFVATVTAAAAAGGPGSSTVAVQRLHTISARVGRRVRVLLNVRGVRRHAALFSASGLPRGLRVNRHGELTGVPRVPGHAAVTIHVIGARAVITARVRITVSAQNPRVRRRRAERGRHR